MSKKEESLQFDLGLKNLSILDFLLKNPDKDEYEKIRKDIDANIETKIEILLEKDIVEVDCCIRYHYNKDASKEKANYMLLRTRFEFSVVPLKKIVQIRPSEGKDEKVYLPDPVALTLAGIVYSTLRGVLFEKLKGSVFGSTLLPLKNPKDLFTALKIE